MDNKEVLGSDFSANVAVMDKILRCDENFDLIKRTLTINDINCVMYYVDGFIKAESMQKLMMHLFTVKDFGDGSTQAARKFADSSLPAVEVDVSNSIDGLTVAVLSGCTAFLCEGFGANALVIDMRTYPARTTSEPENDRVMRGSRDGFVETMIFNTAMIRRRIRDPRLTVKYLSAGTQTRTDMALCYIEGMADGNYVKELSERIKNLNCDSLVMGHRSVAESLIKQRWYNPFPKIRTTERPDAVAATILEGGVCLVCDNSPEVMLFPTSIFDFLQETDDYYFPPLTGTYLRIIRHIVFWMTVLITPVWYLLLMYADLLPGWMDFVIPKEPGQLPIIVQLFLTEFVLDGLKLASLNTPSTLSNSLSVVGGLLLGDFAVQVGWLCPDVILYMAFVAITNFTQSSYELGYAFKYMRMLTLLLTALFGIWGLIGGIVITITLVATNKTANGKRNYLYPLIPFNGRALARLFFRLKKRK
ncbi:MAG: spore germination protein [Ruminococcaceae bacterium]|nr:spore germination protein [Oscillospiraceae bacterium]